MKQHFKLLASLVALLCLAIPVKAQKAPPRIYAQALVDMIVAKYPELDKVSIHTFAPDAPVSTSGIIASKDVTKPGDPDDEEDFSALLSPKPNFYYAKEQGLYKGLFQLLDVRAIPVGSLTLAYKYTNKEDEAKMASTFTAIRDMLKVYIPSQASLFERGRLPAKNNAQALADYVMASHPELVRISFHVAAPGAAICNTYVIAGVDRTSRRLTMLGAIDDEEDFLPLTSNKPSFFEVKERGFYKGILPLRDMSGRSIGVLLLAINTTTKEDEAKFASTMTDIRNQLQVHIESRSALFESAE